VSHWADQFDRYEFLKASVPVTDSMNLEALIHALSNQFSNYTANDADGLKLMGPDGWIHVRSSNTEPIVRIFIEAKTQELCQAMMDQVKALMTNG
jgi:phosphomannomutase